LSPLPPEPFEYCTAARTSVADFWEDPGLFTTELVLAVLPGTGIDLV